MADADTTLVVVARFLALLELFREAAVAFEQEEALAELTVRWPPRGRDEGHVRVGAEFDDGDATPEADPDGQSAPGPTPTSEEERR